MHMRLGLPTKGQPRWCRFSAFVFCKHISVTKALTYVKGPLNSLLLLRFQFVSVSTMVVSERHQRLRLHVTCACPLSACRRGSHDMQVVLITGCGSGLGKALARSFHKHTAFAGKPSGFRVFASDLNLDSIEDLRLEGIEVLALDVTIAESVQRGVSHVEQQAGRLDVLVCNAGIVTIAPLIEEELSEIQAVWNVNT